MCFNPDNPNHVLAQNLDPLLEHWSAVYPNNGVLEWHTAEMIHPSGMKVYFRQDGNRMRVAGTYPITPLGYHADETPKPITINTARPIDKLAKDIKRRYLVSYEKAYKQHLEVIREENTRIAFHNQTERTIETITKKKFYGHGGTVDHRKCSIDGTRSQVTVHTYRNFKQKIDVSFVDLDMEEAMELISLYKQLKGLN